jgi:hypothetical protein
MDDREISSEQEYFDGRTKDGRKPVHQSGHLHSRATKHYSDEPAEPPVVDEKRSPQQIEKERLHYNIEMVRLDQLDTAARYSRRMMELGFDAMDAAPEGAVPAVRDCPRPSDQPRASNIDASTTPPDTASPATTTGTVPKSGDSPRSDRPREPADPYHIPDEPYSRFFENGKPKLRLVSPVSDVGVPPPQHDGPDDKLAAIMEEADKFAAIDRRNRAARVAEPPSSPASHGRASGGIGSSQPNAPRSHAGLGGDKPLSLAQCIAIGERGAKLLVLISEERAKVAHGLVDMAGKLDVRDSFLVDRAHAVVYATLLHMEDSFSDLGFGSWMPFRFPDQWLSFCGVLTRVLAANGLIHAKHADVYRKLLDETPPVDFEGTIDERIKESRTPHNIARCKWNQGAYTMSELRARLQSEVWGPKDEYDKLWEEWESQMIDPQVKPPPENGG